ncbi:hypothetical protein CEP53_014188 [Fusarium sp. AF-6]|nr:hypothetical protein CEP53_014188 [Fusarium sp. AF-6]
MEHSNEINQIASLPSSSKSDVHGYGFAPSRFTQQASNSRGQALVAEEALDSETNFIDFEATDAKIQLEARRRSVNFQKSQYLRYLRKVRESGIEPRDLLNGLEITQSGPTAPPLDFWCLIAVRDRLIIESNALLEGMRSQRMEALMSLSLSGILVLGLAANPLPPSISWINLLNIPAASYGLYTAWKAAAAWKDKHELETVVEQATNWELEEEDRGNILCF